METRWEDCLDEEYMAKVCLAAWNCLRRMVTTNSLYLKPKNIITNLEENSDRN